MKKFRKIAKRTSKKAVVYPKSETSAYTSSGY